MTKILKMLLFFLPVMYLLHSCNDDKFSTDSSHKLSFSADTLSFDTLFTTVGSATHTFMVYNNNKKPLKISRVKLAGGENSPFRINVSGMAGTSVNDVEIWGKDSMYVFVEVTVDPTTVDLPFLIEDSVLFYTNNNVQQVKLLAYGQNARFLRSETFTVDTTLTAGKPYLVYGNLTIDEGKTLTVEKGCLLYFHNGANLIVKGNLVINGTMDEPVILRGDRLDYVLPKYKYDDLSGQWGGIYLTANTGNHVINYAYIRNGKTGIVIENSDENVMPVVKIENSIIHNFDSCGIRAKLADISIGNSQISNCAEHCLKLTGGKYEIEQTTVANYYNNISTDIRRKGASILLSNNDFDLDAEKIYYPLSQANFINVIVYGSSTEEISLQYDVEEDGAAPFNFSFSNSVLRGTKPKEDDEHFNRYTDVIWNVSPQFESAALPFNYSIKADTIMGKADMTVATKYPVDLAGNSRLADGAPDPGAYEYVEETPEN